MKTILAGFAIATLMLSVSTRAWALGEEHFGNDRLSESNYGDWPGVAPLVNSPQRVYHWWVNGNETFFYAGDVEQLNAALRQFAKVEGKTRELVLRPGTGQTKSFQEKAIAFDWSLRLIGGIARHMSKLEKGELIWPTHPVMTVYIGPDFPLEMLEIPEEVQVTRLAELKQRAIDALTSGDKTVRGWGTGELASLDTFDGKSLTIISRMLRDEDDWVRLNVVGSLGQFGAKAKSLLGDLREAEANGDDNLKQQAARAIAAIESAVDSKEAERVHQQGLKRIDAFLRERRREK